MDTRRVLRRPVEAKHFNASESPAPRASLEHPTGKSSERSSTGRNEMKTQKNNEYETVAGNKRDNLTQSNRNIVAVSFIPV